MDQKLLYLFDLLHYNVYIKLKRNFSEKLFSDARQNSKNLKRLSESTGINLRVLYLYKQGKRAIPIMKLHKIMSVLDSKRYAFFVRNLETNVKTIKFGKRGKYITNPKFPIKFSNELSRIIAHVIGDGGIANKHANFTVTYSNKSKELLDEFRKDVKLVFGNVEPIEFYNREAECLEFFYPSIVGLILTRIIGVQNDKNKHFPEFMTMVSENLRYNFLRSIFDDEGNINIEAYKINFEMANYNVVSFVKSMLEDFSIETGSITEINRSPNESLRYKLSISGSQNLMKFYRLINFTSLEKKDRLKTLINFYRLARKEDSIIDNAIIDLLNIRKLSFYELAVELQKQGIGFFRENLRRLINSGYVKFENCYAGKGIRRIYRLEREKAKDGFTKISLISGPES